jgi:hypothetical protein
VAPARGGEIQRQKTITAKQNALVLIIQGSSANGAGFRLWEDLTIIRVGKVVAGVIHKWMVRIIAGLKPRAVLPCPCTRY